MCQLCGWQSHCHQIVGTLLCQTGHAFCLAYIEYMPLGFSSRSSTRQSTGALTASRWSLQHESPCPAGLAPWPKDQSQPPFSSSLYCCHSDGETCALEERHWQACHHGNKGSAERDAWSSKMPPELCSSNGYSSNDYSSNTFCYLFVTRVTRVTFFPLPETVTRVTLFITLLEFSSNGFE